MKPENTVVKILGSPVHIDGKLINRIKYDLTHINRGWDTAKRDYNPPSPKRKQIGDDEVEDLFSQFEYYEIEWSEENKREEEIGGKKYYRYVAYVYDEEERLKIVVDIPFDFENEATIVTIHGK